METAQSEHLLKLVRKHRAHVFDLDGERHERAVHRIMRSDAWRTHVFEPRRAAEASRQSARLESLGY
jgi:hypothetical protein